MGSGSLGWGSRYYKVVPNTILLTLVISNEEFEPQDDLLTDLKEGAGYIG